MLVFNADHAGVLSHLTFEGPAVNMMAHQHLLKVTLFLVCCLFFVYVSLALIPASPVLSNSVAVLESCRLKHPQTRPHLLEFVVGQWTHRNHGVQKNGRIYSSSSSSLKASVGEVMETDKTEPDPHVTELPDSFEDSIARMSTATLQALGEVCTSSFGNSLAVHLIDVDAGRSWFSSLERRSAHAIRNFTCRIIHPGRSLRLQFVHDSSGTRHMQGKSSCWADETFCTLHEEQIPPLAISELN